MAAKTTEEVATVLTGDSSGVEGAFARATAAAKGNAKAEKAVADEIKRIRDKRDRDAALAPIREAQSAIKAGEDKAKAEARQAERAKAAGRTQADAKAKAAKAGADGEARAKREADKKREDEAKAMRDRAEREERQRKASTVGNIRAELKTNFVDNAKEKLGGFLQNKLGLSEDAAQGLVARVASIAPALGAAGIGAGILVKAFTASRDRANEQAEKMHDLNEEMIAASRVNVFASSTDGVASLSDAIEQSKKNIKDARDAQNENDPYGQGGGLFGNLRTLFLQASQAKGQILQDLGFDFGQESSADKQERERRNLELNSRIAQQDQKKGISLRSQAINQELILTNTRLRGDQQTVAIQDLQLKKEAALSDLRKRKDFNKDDIDRTALGFDMQIRQQEELRAAVSARYDLQNRIMDLEATALNSSQQGVAAAQMRNDEIRAELNNRKLLTEEEKRALELEQRQNQNTVRQAQLLQVMKSPAQQNREAIAQTRREVRLRQAQDRINRTDGLRSIERDINGKILGGIDIVTGLRRAVSNEFDQKQNRKEDFKDRLQPGGGFGETLGSTGGLDRPKFERETYTRPYEDLKNGINDQSPGNTLLSAAKAQVEAINISNDYLKNISEQVTDMQYSQ